MAKITVMNPTRESPKWDPFIAEPSNELVSLESSQTAAADQAHSSIDKQPKAVNVNPKPKASASTCHRGVLDGFSSMQEARWATMEQLAGRQNVSKEECAKLLASSELEQEKLRLRHQDDRERLDWEHELEMQRQRLKFQLLSQSAMSGSGGQGGATVGLGQHVESSSHSSSLSGEGGSFLDGYLSSLAKSMPSSCSHLSLPSSSITSWDTSICVSSTAMAVSAAASLLALSALSSSIIRSPSWKNSSTVKSSPASCVIAKVCTAMHAVIQNDAMFKW
ncbi:hypothetical protein K439DRAFT_1610990 [Ramaria rubella]|nr:hypothetical protein K439DRAFT_1610990 [Ramaria rubella]